MTMNPYLSWAILLVVAGGLGWYYTNGSAPKAKTAVRTAIEKTEAVAAPKKQKRKAKASEPAAAKKPEVKKSEVQTVVSPPTTEDDKPDEEVDRKEMARRLAAIKNGISPAVAPSKSQKKKAKKASQLESGSHASSTTGADADDDLSPAASPEVNATVPSAGYVSDMLEAPAPAASVLRVTGNLESEPKKQKAQNFKQVETKKQRQNRLKNEARKQQVQEAEQERRRLLEKQLHTAREFERQEAARAKPPTSNAWQTQSAKPAVASSSQPAPAAPAAAPVQLLDTFEPTSTAPAQQKWEQSLPSEEEQIRILGASSADDDWTTVSSKKVNKKKSGKTDESVSEASASESQPTPVAPTPVEPRVTVTPTYLPDILRSREKGHPLDSDWAA